MPGGELQLQMLRSLSQAPSSFENQLYFYKTESLDYLLKAGSCEDFFPLEKRFLTNKQKKKTEFPFEMEKYECGWNECLSFPSLKLLLKTSMEKFKGVIAQNILLLFSCWLL